MMNNKLSKILKLAGDLTKSELMMLNQAVVSLIKISKMLILRKLLFPFKREI